MFKDMFYDPKALFEMLHQQSVAPPAAPAAPPMPPQGGPPMPGAGGGDNPIMSLLQGLFQSQSQADPALATGGPGRFGGPMGPGMAQSAPLMDPRVGGGPIPNPSMGNPFTEAASVPTAARAPGPPQGGGIPPFETTVQPAQPDFLGGLMQNAKGVDWGGMLKSALEGGMRGMAMTPLSPNNPGGLSTLGAGFTSVRDKKKAEDAAKAKAEADKSKLRFDQGLAVRKDTREERKANRDDADLKRKEEESRVKNQVAVDKIMRVGPGGTLPTDAKFKLQDQLLRYADKINKNGLMQPTELDAALRREQQRLEAYYGVSGGAQGGTPGAGQPAQTQGPAVGATARNPKTGERLRWDGTSWQPAQ